MFANPELVESLGERLGVTGNHDLQWVPVCRDWNTYRNETYLLFENGQSYPSLIVKASNAREELQGEHDNLKRLAAGATPAFRGTVPEVVEFRQIDNRWYLVQTSVQGRLLTANLHRLAREGAFFRRVLTNATSWLFDFHRSTGVVETPAPDLAIRFAECAEEFFDRFRVSDRSKAWIQECAWVLDDDSIAAIPMVTSHGDFCPANLLVDGDRIGVIDWEMPNRREIAPTDLLHFIHSYALETSRDEHDHLDRLERLMFGEDPAARVVAECLTRYRAELPTDSRVLDILPTLFWMESAVDKARYMDAADTPNPGYSSYMIFAEGSCLNLERLGGRGWTE